MAYIIQSNILTNPFSYERIMERRTHHSYKVIQICRDNNLSHFCQIIFFNSLQAPKKEQALFQSLAEQTARVSTIATFAFHLIILQIIEQKKETSTHPFCNDGRNSELTKRRTCLISTPQPARYILQVVTVLRCLFQDHIVN